MLKFNIDDIVAVSINESGFPVSKSDYGWYKTEKLKIISSIIIATYDGEDMTASQYLIHDPSNSLKAYLSLNVPYSRQLSFTADYSTKYLNKLNSVWIDDDMIDGFATLPDGVFCQKCNDFNPYISTLNWVCYYCKNYSG